MLILLLVEQKKTLCIRIMFHPDLGCTDTEPESESEEEINESTVLD